MKLTEKNKFKNFNLQEFEIEGIEGCFYINNLVYDTWCEYYPDEANGDYTCHVQMVEYDISYQDDYDNVIKVELEKEFVEGNLTIAIEETIDWHTFIHDNYEK